MVQTTGRAASTAEPGSQRTILVAGDSLSAEYGLKRDSGWVSLIAQKLAGENYGYRIQNSSISGDTTSGGVSRMPELLKRYAPEIVIIELGSNDALRGLSLAQTKENLSSMIQMAQEANARVLLVGMQIPPNYGASYAEQFRRIFTTLEARHEVGLVPFLLESIATGRQWFQADGIHPNESAQPILAKNVWAGLAPMLTR